MRKTFFEQWYHRHWFSSLPLILSRHAHTNWEWVAEISLSCRNWIIYTQVPIILQRSKFFHGFPMQSKNIRVVTRERLHLPSYSFHMLERKNIMIAIVRSEKSPPTTKHCMKKALYKHVSINGSKYRLLNYI